MGKQDIIEKKRLKRFYSKLDMLMAENIYNVDEEGNDISKSYDEMGSIVYDWIIEDADIRLLTSDFIKQEIKNTFDDWIYLRKKIHELNLM